MTDEQRLDAIVQTMMEISKDGVLPHSTVYDKNRAKGLPSSRSLWACYTHGYAAIGSALGLEPEGRHNPQSTFCECGEKSTNLRLVRVSSHHSKVLMLLCDDCVKIHDEIESQDWGWKVPERRGWRW